MPRFILKFKMRGRANRDRPDRVVERDDVLLGSRPLADVYVPDRLVPQEALSFQFDGVHLSMDVRTRLAGVFIDGRPVDGQGQVKSGSTIQIGHALVECVVDAAKGECTLTTNEQYLQAVVDGIVTKSKPAKPFALVDSGPQEHRWGKSAVLATSNWLAAALGLALLAAFPFVKDTDTLSRGELFHSHAIGAAGGPENCAACHAPMSSDYGPKCAACHKGLDSKTTHPYARAGDVSCNACHAEHVGADADIIPSMKKSDSGWPSTCLRCHAGEPYPAADAPAATVAVAKTRLRDMRGDAFARQLLVDGFSHNDHRVPKPGGVVPVPGGAPKRGAAPIACAECHKLLGPRERNRAIPTAEFAAVSYGKCLECHAEWRVEIHGRDEGGKSCYECHAKADSPAEITEDLKSVDLPATASKWVLKPRDHDFKKNECLACHVLSKSSLDHRTPIAEKVFRHDHHLRTIAPPSGGELAFSQDCRSCHDALAGSMSLAGAPIVNTTGCAKCHVDSEPTPVPVKEGATRRVVDMVHKLHTVDAASLSRSALRYASRDSLARGCLSCHEPVAGAAPMNFKEGTSDCKACHAGHENLGEGKCVLCHVDRAPGKNRELNGRLEFRHSEPGIFDKEKATTKTTAAMRRFDHKSVGHAGHECAECHRAETIDGATRVLDVAWPAFDDDACVKCHVRERFHR
jgi:hypothetical protein